MGILANALVIGKIISLASNVINKEWKSSPKGRTAQRCPVCEGSGKGELIITSGTVNAGTGYCPPCHGCGGKGWVAV